MPILALGACVTTADGVQANATGSIGAAGDPGARGTLLQRGIASYYHHGRRTASGERFDPGAMTAAHRTLPFGSRVRVTDERTGRSVIVRINDRGPFTRGRVIDLAHGPARALGMTGAGVARVAVHRLD